MGKICVIIGTCPEIIKMSPVVRACEGQGADYFVIHTGQHYSYNMDRVFFGKLELPDAKYNLDVGSGSGRHGEQTGRMLSGIEKILIVEKPDAVLVEGDTNTVLAGALAQSKYVPLAELRELRASCDGFKRNRKVITDGSEEG